MTVTDTTNVNLARDGRPAAATRRASFTLALLTRLLIAAAAWRAASVPGPAGADEWITLARPDRGPVDLPAPEAWSPAPTLTYSLFSRLMGVGSTTSPADSGPLVTESPLGAPGSWQRLGHSEFIFDPRGYEPSGFWFSPVPPPPHGTESAVRAGWWGVAANGSANKVGEYQDLQSAPFWDADLLSSDGVRTLDLSATGLDNETTQADLYYFTPNAFTSVQYQRFLHRLDHDPLTNLPTTDNSLGIVGEDLHVGQDYAVRIQDFKTTLGGTLSPHVKYRVHVWLRRKYGERQALGTQHGAPGTTDCRTCHVLSQRQEIDWFTARVEPVLETKLGPITVQYSRPMRSFSQNDAVVARSYGGFHGYPNYTGEYPYAVVPDTISQTDRLRLSTPLPLDTRLYTLLHRGDTRNNFRDTRRDYYGGDLRLTNTFFTHWTLHGFARLNRQLNQLPPSLLPPEDEAVSVNTSIIPPYGLRHPVDYLRTAAGGSGEWRPFEGETWAGRPVFSFGGEHGLIARSYADYVVVNPPAVYDQDRTEYTSYFAGTKVKWNSQFNTFLRYEGRVIADPLYGANLYSDITNTNVPEQEDTIRIGATWMPATNLLAAASMGFEHRQNHSPIARFEEDNYPVTVTLWYAPQRRWSLAGGYGYYSNWLDQDIYFPSDNPTTAALDRQAWNYAGRAHLANLSSRFAWSPAVTLSGGLQYVWGQDTLDPLAPWPDLPDYIDIRVDTSRVHGGLDWQSSERVSGYLRYIYEDYHDERLAAVNGHAHLVLAGLTALY